MSLIPSVHLYTEMPLHPREKELFPPTSELHHMQKLAVSLCANKEVAIHNNNASLAVLCRALHNVLLDYGFQKPPQNMPPQKGVVRKIL